MKKFVVCLLILFTVGCSTSFEAVFVAPFRYKKILNNVDMSILIDVTKFTIYGKYFNIEGSFNYQDAYSDIDLVLISKDNEISYDLFIEDNDSLISFKTNEHINEGINLENISFDNYVVLIKVGNGDEFKYYSLSNKTEYDDLEYYTLTRDNQNNKIDISFSDYNGLTFMKTEMTSKGNVQNICDIVVDAGHGGNDPGAVNGKYLEKDFNLMYATMLKEELEDLGLKICMTRERDFLPKEYGVNSRTSLSYESKAKLMLSLHLNSTTTYVKNGGVEIYTGYNANSIFPKVIADNIVNNTTTEYSPSKNYKIADGVYTRTYSKADINSSKKMAEKAGWTIYENMNTKTTYYYFIRETGGIITNALTDGRNPDYEANPYYNSNHGVEAYLLELGYISNATNLKKLINEKEGYIKGIVESVKYYLDN